MTTENINFNQLLNDLDKLNHQTIVLVNDGLEKGTPLVNIASMTGLAESWLQDNAKLRTKLLNDLAKLNPQTRVLVDNGLEKETPLVNIANMTGLAESWLQYYAYTKLKTIPPSEPSKWTPVVKWTLVVVSAIAIGVVAYTVKNYFQSKVTSKPVLGPIELIPIPFPEPKLSLPQPQLTKDCSIAGKNLFRDSLRDGGCGPVMVKIIPSKKIAGHFIMGDERGDKDEQPVHSVSVESFAMCRYEVTFAEYDRFAKATNQDEPDEQGYGRGNHPVINVSWDDAMAYVDWLSKQTGKDYRLPSEAQWEYAARAGTTTKYWWGNVASHEYANYGTQKCCDGLIKGKDDWKYTSPVGSFAPNPFGLYDMIGNVWEWVVDPYHNNYENAPKDGSVWKDSNDEEIGDGWVLRGCSWYNNPRICRVANRYSNNEGGNNIGFRCILDF